MPPDGIPEGVGKVKQEVCCRAGCRFVAGFVAGQRIAGIAGNATITRFFQSLHFPDNESNKSIKENMKNKNSRPDICLQVF